MILGALTCLLLRFLLRLPNCFSSRGFALDQPRTNFSVRSNVEFHYRSNKQLCGGYALGCRSRCEPPNGYAKRERHCGLGSRSAKARNITSCRHCEANYSRRTIPLRVVDRPSSTRLPRLSLLTQVEHFPVDRRCSTQEPILGVIRSPIYSPPAEQNTLLSATIDEALRWCDRSRLSQGVEYRAGDRRNRIF